MNKTKNSTKAVPVRREDLLAAWAVLANLAASLDQIAFSARQREITIGRADRQVAGTNPLERLLSLRSARQGLERGSLCG